MIKTILIFSLLTRSLTFAKESTPEKIKQSSNSLQRFANKSYHRVSEFFCFKSQIECDAEKASNRISEAKDNIIDKTNELINKIN